MVKRREYWLDVLKIISMFFVILLHTVCYGVNDKLLSLSLLIYFSGVFAIPLFFMVNGYLLLRKNENINYALKKIIKIIIIAFMWNIPIFLGTLILKGKIINLFYNVFLNFNQHGYYWQFWFLGALIIIYLFLPLLQRLFNNEKGHYKYFIIIFIVICVFADIFNIYNCSVGNGIIKDNIIQTYRLWTWIMFFCLGGFINKSNIFENISKRNHIFITAILIIITILYEYLFALKFYNSLFAENFYDSFIVIITCISIFTLFKKIEFNRFKSKIVLLSSLSMGVYIIHPSIIRVLKHFYSLNNNYFNIFASIIVYLVSLTISYIIMKIPKISNLIKI